MLSLSLYAFCLKFLSCRLSRVVSPFILLLLFILELSVFAGSPRLSQPMTEADFSTGVGRTSGLAEIARMCGRLGVYISQGFLSVHR